MNDEYKYTTISLIQILSMSNYTHADLYNIRTVAERVKSMRTDGVELDDNTIWGLYRNEAKKLPTRSNN